VRVTEREREREREREMDTQKGWERMAMWNTKAGDRKRDTTREKELTVPTRGLCGEMNGNTCSWLGGHSREQETRGREINKVT